MTLAEEAMLFLDTGEISVLSEELLDEIDLQEQIMDTELDGDSFNGYSYDDESSGA